MSELPKTLERFGESTTATGVDGDGNEYQVVATPPDFIADVILRYNAFDNQQKKIDDLTGRKLNKDMQKVEARFDRPTGFWRVDLVDNVYGITKKEAEDTAENRLKLYHAAIDKNEV